MSAGTAEHRVLPRPDDRPRRTGRVEARLRAAVPPLLLVSVLIAIWYGIIAVGLVSPLLLPEPWDVVVQAWAMLQNMLSGGFVLDAFLVTAQEIVYGFVIADSRVGRQAVMPLLIAVNSVPKVALAPVFVAWLGFGMSSKIVMAAFISFFPVVVATAAGFNATDEAALELFRANRASRWQTVVKLKLPSAAPFIIAGLRTAAVFAVVGAVIGEFLGGSGGLGELVRQASNNLDMDRVFGYIFYLSLLGMAMYALVTLIERRVAKWAGSRTGPGSGV